MEGAERPRVSCDEQAAARVAVEAVDQLEALVGAQPPERLDHAEAQPAAAVHREARGLVEYEEPVILVDDRLRQGCAQLRRWLARVGSRDHAHRGGAAPGRRPAAGL